MRLLTTVTTRSRRRCDSFKIRFNFDQTTLTSSQPPNESTQRTTAAGAETIASRMTVKVSQRRVDFISRPELAPVPTGPGGVKTGASVLRLIDRGRYRHSLNKPRETGRTRQRPGTALFRPRNLPQSPNNHSAQKKGLNQSD